MPANPPSRSTGTLPLTIGLMTLHLALYSGVEDSATRRSQFIEAEVPDVADPTKTTKVLHPVGMKSYDKVTGADVEKSDIIKCAEAADGTLVPVSDEELQAFCAENGDTEFVGFLDRAEFDATYVIEKKYQVRPAKLKVAGKTQKGESPFAKPYALILDTLRTESKIALVKFTQRGNAKYYGLLPDGSLCSLLFDEEVREALPLPVVQFTADEKKLASALVKKFTLKDAPVLTDESSTKIQEFVETKAKAMAEGTEVVLPTVNEPEVDTSADLMAMLSASLEG
jgi:non-homologous end joining protein Ku